MSDDAGRPILPPVPPGVECNPPRRCACPSDDARRCVELRYPEPPMANLDPDWSPLDRWRDDEPCDCVCHDTDEDWLDEEDDDAR